MTKISSGGESTKYCTMCKLTKPLSDYNKWYATKDGLQTHCRECKTAMRRAWYLKNKEHSQAQRLAWQRKHPEVYAQLSNQRRIQSTLSPESKVKTRAYMAKIRNDVCFYCGGRKTKMSYDHVYPLAKGGTDHWFNLVRACQSCNSSKGAKSRVTGYA